MNIIKLGKIVSTVGLKGDMKCLLYSDNPTWLDKTAYITFNEKDIPVIVKRHPYSGRNILCLCRVDSANSIEEAKTLVGQSVWIARDELEPLPENEFYFEDMINKSILDAEGVVEKVRHVHDFGAGIVFECYSGRYLHIQEILEIIG